MYVPQDLDSPYDRDGLYPTLYYSSKCVAPFKVLLNPSLIVFF